MPGPQPPHVDYAVPAAVPRSSRRPRAERGSSPLWGGPGRARLKVGCWVAAGLLALPLLLPLLVPDETGADSPEEAVSLLLHGIADLDPVAVASAIDPEELEDRARADRAYGRFSGRVIRVGDEVPPDVALLLVEAERQLGGALEARTLATVAAFDLELADLRLEREYDPGDSGDGVRVVVTGGLLDVHIEPGRLPGGAGDLDPASYDVPIAEGWRRDGFEFDPALMTVERDGRWYVSLESSAADLLPEFR